MNHFCFNDLQSRAGVSPALRAREREPKKSTCALSVGLRPSGGQADCPPYFQR